LVNKTKHIFCFVFSALHIIHSVWELCLLRCFNVYLLATDGHWKMRYGAGLKSFELHTFPANFHKNGAKNVYTRDAMAVDSRKAAFFMFKVQYTTTFASVPQRQREIVSFQAASSYSPRSMTASERATHKWGNLERKVTYGAGVDQTFNVQQVIIKNQRYLGRNADDNVIELTLVS